MAARKKKPPSLARARGKKRGPKTKLTPELREAILRHLRVGAFLKHAAAAVRIDESTLYDWRDRAARGQQPYLDFITEVEGVRAEDAIRSQAVITRAQLQHIDGDYRAAQWNLERKFPKEYGQAAARAAAVTVRTGAASGGSDDDGNETKVVFVLPPNGRRPGEDEDGR